MNLPGLRNNFKFANCNVFPTQVPRQSPLLSCGVVSNNNAVSNMMQYLVHYFKDSILKSKYLILKSLSRWSFCFYDHMLPNGTLTGLIRLLLLWGLGQALGHLLLLGCWHSAFHKPCSRLGFGALAGWALSFQKQVWENKNIYQQLEA